MNNSEQDRRTLKTRKALHDALFGLMSEKQYNRITIQDIIDRANVGRSTFYSHYATKDELLISSIEILMENLNKYISDCIGKGEDKIRLIPVAELFQHIMENSKLMRGLIKAESVELFLDKALSYWNVQIEQYLNSRLSTRKETKVPITILTNHITSTLIYLLKWWVTNKMPYTPTQMEQYFQELITPSIELIVN